MRDALARREPSALATFFDAYFDRVHGYVRRLVREEHVAEDLTQDVFLHVHRALPSYDPARPLAPWVFTIASNKIRDHWRSRRLRGDQESLTGDSHGDDPSLVAPPDPVADHVTADEASARLVEAIDGLPELLRQTLVLRYYEGLSFEAIGAIVNRNETAVRKRYSRALQELRRVLGGASASDSGIRGPIEPGRA